MAQNKKTTQDETFYAAK